MLRKKKTVLENSTVLNKRDDNEEARKLPTALRLGWIKRFIVILAFACFMK